MNRGRAPSSRSYDSPMGRSSPSAGRFSHPNRHMTGADGNYSDDSFRSGGGRSRGRRGNANHMSPASCHTSSNPGPKMAWVRKQTDETNQNASNAGDGDSKHLDSSVALDSAQSLAPSNSKESQLDETEVGSFARSNTKARQLDETKAPIDKPVLKGAVDRSTLHHNFSSKHINTIQIDSHPSVQFGAADQPSPEESAKSVGSPGDLGHSDESKQLDSSVALDSAESLAPSNSKERQLDETLVGSFGRSNSNVRQLDETEVHIDKVVVKRAADQPSREQSKPFDICPPKTGVSLKPPLHSINKEKRTANKRTLEGQGEILEQGMVLLKGYLSVDDQVRIVKQCRQLGLGIGGFYQPGYLEGAKLNLKMMCLGKNWDPNTSQYGECRPYDGAKPPLIPVEFCQLVERAMKDSRALVERNSKGSNVENIIPWMSPDICIVNFYSSSGRLGLHQDKDESDASLKKGLPVVSFSIGDTGVFLYGDSRNEKDAKKVLLESGDVLIFGGKSRHIFHGVQSVDPDTAPMFLLQETNLSPGRLNLTFRQH